MIRSIYCSYPDYSIRTGDGFVRVPFRAGDTVTPLFVERFEPFLPVPSIVAETRDAVDGELLFPTWMDIRGTDDDAKLPTLVWGFATPMEEKGEIIWDDRYVFNDKCNLLFVPVPVLLLPVNTENGLLFPIEAREAGGLVVLVRLATCILL